jgi:hypothetical protein
MQDERKDDVEETEEVEGHRRFGPSEPEDPERLAQRGEDSEEDEVEAHRRFGPEEFGKRY